MSEGRKVEMKRRSYSTIITVTVTRSYLDEQCGTERRLVMKARATI